MTLDEKLGQMTQAERGSVSTSDITTYRLGSILSGGGSSPSPNNATSWANMYDTFQQAALATPLGIPIIYGVDAVHGHNNVYGATIFPHNIGLGATRDQALVQQIGQAVATEVTGTGLDWDFAPCLCVARNDRWGRTYESFGEVPAIPNAMTAFVTGLQGSTLGGPTRFWQPQSITWATAAPPAAWTRATPSCPKPSCAPSIYRRSRPPSRAVSAAS